MNCKKDWKFKVTHYISYSFNGGLDVQTKVEVVKRKGHSYLNQEVRNACDSYLRKCTEEINSQGKVLERFKKAEKE